MALCVHITLLKVNNRIQYVTPHDNELRSFCFHKCNNIIIERDETAGVYIPG